MLNNHHIRTPEELFDTHEDWIYSSLIDPAKEARIVEVLHDFSSALYDGITDEANGKELGKKFYISEVRGFTLKMATIPTPMRLTERTIVFDEIYVGSRGGIGPILHNSSGVSENGEIIRWLDPCFRKFLHDLGWCCGILHDHDKEHTGEKVIIYQFRKKEW